VKDAMTSPDAVSPALRYARLKLMDPALPYRLRLLSYVRICSSVLRAMDPPRHSGAGPVAGSLYLTLLGALAHRDPEWWARCRVTPAAGLVSADPVIASLLAPLNRAMEALADEDADRGLAPPASHEAKVRS
jgi:hypothetical protein